jgi:calcium-dependent protein kinase
VEQNGTQNNTETKSEKPKRKQAVAVQDQKKTRTTVSDGRDKNVIPLGKRTNFGYNRDFAKKYTLGKLLGHGQFGYTYIGIEKATSNKAAIKCIEKKQVNPDNLFVHLVLQHSLYCSFSSEESSSRSAHFWSWVGVRLS